MFKDMSIHFEQPIEEDVLICPVCETPVSDVRHAFKEEHKGKLLAFDRQECLKEFLEDPEKYDAEEDEEETRTI